MIRPSLRHILRLSLFGALVLALPQASAEAPPVAPGDGGRQQHFEIKAAPGQVAMVPLGEGDRTGQHIAVQVSAGILKSAKYHGACGRVLLHGETAERIPFFAPMPATEGAPGASVCGETGCTCPNARAGMIHVDRRPGFLIGDGGVDVPREVPVLPGGEAPRPVAEDPQPGCFGWLELVVDTTGLKVGTQILADVGFYAQGAPLDGPPTHAERPVAAVVTP